MFAPRLGGEKLDPVPQYLHFPPTNSLNIIHGAGTEFGGNPDASAALIALILKAHLGTVRLSRLAWVLVGNVQR